MAHIQTRSHWLAVYVAYLSRCVLKMDHHCPWYVQHIFKHQRKPCFTLCLMLFDMFSFRVNNCVGFSNYKFFILFLTYASLYCLVICATVTQYFIKFWTVSTATSPVFPLSDQVLLPVSKANCKLYKCIQERQYWFVEINKVQSGCGEAHDGTLLSPVRCPTLVRVTADQKIHLRKLYLKETFSF